MDNPNIAIPSKVALSFHERISNINDKDCFIEVAGILECVDVPDFGKMYELKKKSKNLNVL